MILTIDNSYSKLTGLSALQEKALKKELSYTVGGSSSFFSSYGPRKKSLLSKTGEFPTGLLSRVTALLGSECKIVDNRVKPKIIVTRAYENFNVTPYLDQTAASVVATYKERGIISMPTGTGKSMVIALIASRLNLKTLVIVPSLEIKKQLQETLIAFKNVVVENIDSRALNSAAGFDCLIIDEAHHVAAKTYQKLNKTVWKGIYYRFFLTATPFRNDSEEQLLFESIAGQVIYKLNYVDAITKGYIVPIESYYIEMPKQTTEAYTYAQVYKELVVENVVRNATISKLLLTLNNAGTRTLCLVREVLHGKILSDMTGIPFVSGEDEASRDYIRQFNSGGIVALIGTTGILGEGVDTKPCEFVIIAGLGKAKSQFMQQVGRAVRRFPGKESAKIILIKDKSHKFTSRHFKIQQTILKDEYGVISQKLEI